MREALAERLLAEVMGWTPEDVARERPDLQALAAYKYDDYQQFSPGMRFVESLALWLNQFETTDQRRIAYQFVRSRLVFCSSAEMNHLVSIAYPDYIRPIVMRRAALDAKIEERFVHRIAALSTFKARQRQCLFLGLSDGARIDVFRRSNSSDLSHEQILQTHELTAPRVEELLQKLSADLAGLPDHQAPSEGWKFRTIVLLDDFSGSGFTYLRRGGDGRSFDGKIGKFYHSLTQEPASRLVTASETEILVVLYMATTKAKQQLEEISKAMWDPLHLQHSVIVVHAMTDSVCLRPDDDNTMADLIGAYYDPAVEDEHTRKGGTADVKYGFAYCGLPLVLSHNTPNNSLSLLWAQTDKVRALFPRVSRHKRES